MASDAVGSEVVSTVVGYKITKGQFNETSPNLPQRVDIFGEANEANQTGLVTAAVQITTAKKAGEDYGFGSPIHMAARILFPVSGDGIGGIPVFVRAQAEASGASAKLWEINPTGVATGNGTHTIVIAGREGIDGDRYDINIETGDDAAAVSGKIEAAVNLIISSPVLANDTTYSTILTSKWKGLTANDIVVSVDVNDNALGLTYDVEDVADGAATPSISQALLDLGNDWATIILNTYGTVESIMDSLEATNGIPDPISPTGRFTGTIMKPFIALTGSTDDDPSLITDTRKEDVTIAICPAPLSLGLPLEAAANVCRLFARQSQDNPHGDIINQSYPDMPIPADDDIGLMAIFENRDAIVKKGSSTVDLNVGRYRIKDFVTTYHPDGEIPPQFRYARNLMLDLNVFFGYFLLEETFLVGKTLAGNDDQIVVSGVVKPKTWQGIIHEYANDLASRALITDASFMQDSLLVVISSSNPDRLETSFRYKRTAIGRISATTAEAGFSFGG